MEIWSNKKKIALKHCLWKTCFCERSRNSRIFPDAPRAFLDYPDVSLRFKFEECLDIILMRLQSNLDIILAKTETNQKLFFCELQLAKPKKIQNSFIWRNFTPRPNPIINVHWCWWRGFGNVWGTKCNQKFYQSNQVFQKSCAFYIYLVTFHAFKVVPCLVWVSFLHVERVSKERIIN